MLQSVPPPKIKTCQCLGIESTAHTFGVGLASSDKGIIMDVNSRYQMPEGKGIHPREAAQHHCEVAPQVLKQLIETTQISLKDVDAIGFSAGPGLGPALRTGATVARALAIMYNKPLIPVHHAIGHIEIASFSTGASDPLIVLVSGGHTTISAYGGNYWRIFGETEDITLGNLFDMFARKAGLSSPGGPIVESLASAGKKFLGLPYVVKGTDVSYSGILTAAIRMLQKGVDLEDLCYSIQEIAFAMLAEVTERALAHTEKKEVLLTGGVAANIRLQEIIRIAADEQNAAFHVVPKAYSGDCGAQIAWTGLLAYQSGVSVEAGKSYVKPRWRLDCVKIPWR